MKVPNIGNISAALYVVRDCAVQWTSALIRVVHEKDYADGTAGKYMSGKRFTAP